MSFGHSVLMGTIAATQICHVDSWDASSRNQTTTWDWNGEIDVASTLQKLSQKLCYRISREKVSGQRATARTHGSSSQVLRNEPIYVYLMFLFAGPVYKVHGSWQEVENSLTDFLPMCNAHTPGSHERVWIKFWQVVIETCLHWN